MNPRDLMEKIVQVLDKTYYGDVRFETGNVLSIGKNKVEENINTASSMGLCIRIFSDNKWYYLGFDDINEEKILDETRKLVKKIDDKPSKLVIKDPWEIDKEIKVMVKWETMWEGLS